MNSGVAAAEVALLNEIGEFFLAGHRECPENDPTLKYAWALRNVYRNIPFSFEEDFELAPVRGLYHQAYFGVLYNGQAWPDYSRAEEKKRRYGDERIRAVVERTKEYWREYDVMEALKATFNEEDKAIFAANEAARQGFFSSWQGHATLDYKTILEKGLAHYSPRIEEKLRRLDTATPDGEKQRTFYRALLIVLEGVECLTGRYRDECERRAQELPPEDARRERWQRLQQAFSRILTGPPNSFFEALARHHFFFVLDGWDNGGRVDQLLYPFYEKDLKAGRIDRKRAEDLFFQALELWGRMEWCWNLRIGGRQADGSDATNELTYAVLEARNRVRRPKPGVSLSIAKTTPKELLKKALEVIATGLGQPALYNEELYVETLQRLGVPWEDAVEYTFGGCTETHIAGKSSGRDSVFNVAKCLELALYNGRVSRTGAKLGLETGDPANFASFDEFFAAYKKQVEYLIDRFVHYRNRLQQIVARLQPALFRSLFVQGSIERGRSDSAGGAIYSHGLVNVFGVPNSANALFAIKRLVFENKLAPMSALIEALDKNFAGCEGLRRLCLAQPKYGNDLDEVDALAKEVADHVFGYIQTHTLWNGGRYYGFCAFRNHIGFGEATGATPDGRFAGAPLADSMGPVQGTDTHGPTAMINSVTKLDLSLAIVTPVVNLKFCKEHFAPGQHDNLIALVRTYFQKGGLQLQINVVNRETLLDAIEHPENHGDLIVRVAGYCDYFNNLPLAARKEIAARTEY